MEKTYAPQVFHEVGSQKLTYYNFLIARTNCDRISVSNTWISHDWKAHPQTKVSLKILTGCIRLLLVKLNNWKNPSHYLKPEVHILNAEKEINAVITVPIGYAFNYSAIIPGSTMEITTNTPIEDIQGGYSTFDKNRWYFESFF